MGRSATFKYTDDANGAPPLDEQLLSILTSAKPQFKKAIRRTAKWGKGYKVPVLGHYLSDKKYQEIEDKLRSGDIEVVQGKNLKVFPNSKKDKELAALGYGGLVKYLATNNLAPWPATGVFLPKKDTGLDKDKIVLTGSPESPGFYEAGVHELLHASRPAHGAIETSQDFVGLPNIFSISNLLDNIIAPGSTANFNRYSKGVLNQAMKEGVLQRTKDTRGIYGKLQKVDDALQQYNN